MEGSCRPHWSAATRLQAIAGTEDEIGWFVKNARLFWRVVLETGKSEIRQLHLRRAPCSSDLAADSTCIGGKAWRWTCFFQPVLLATNPVPWDWELRRTESVHSLWLHSWPPMPLIGLHVPTLPHWGIRVPSHKFRRYSQSIAPCFVYWRACWEGSENSPSSWE